jgi:hypothetical protein
MDALVHGQAVSSVNPSRDNHGLSCDSEQSSREPTPTPTAHRNTPPAADPSSDDDKPLTHWAGPSHTHAASSDDDKPLTLWAPTFRQAFRRRSASPLAPHTPAPPAAHPDAHSVSSDDLMDGILLSSPVIGTAEERKSINRRKAARKRQATVEKRKLAAQEQSEHARATDAQVEANGVTALHLFFDDILATLQSNGCTFGDLCLYVFDPVYKQGITRWAGFFQVPGLVERILELWVAQQSDTARGRVVAWCVSFVCRLVNREARDITESGNLQTAKDGIDDAFLRAYHPEKMYAYLAEKADVFMAVARAFGTSLRQANCSKARQEKKNAVRFYRESQEIRLSCPYQLLGFVGEALLGEYSRKNSDPRKSRTVYVYATGAQRQLISVLSHLGICESYTSLIYHPTAATSRASEIEPVTQLARSASAISLPVVSTAVPSPPVDSESSDDTDSASETEAVTPARPQKRRKPRQAGTMHRLSTSMRGFARRLVAMFHVCTAYDNINLEFNRAETTLSSKSTSCDFPNTMQ